ncbi:MAG TPA: DUF4276 family protein [Nannocystis exedens]|nr:DUF4276 family protein [Nannocystis exedens]
MKRLIVVVEGQTEEAFVKEVIGPHLDALKVYTSVTIVGKVVVGRRGHRGRGGGRFVNWRKDLQRILCGDRSADLAVTTLFDLYGLPGDFPGIRESAELDSRGRCEALEAALSTELGDGRLIPYIQRHEFEALVLASLRSLRSLLDAKDDLDGLKNLETELRNLDPEDVNEGRHTAPSKRLCRHVPGYRKVVHGPLATADTGLTTLRKRCPRFHRWVVKLENLGD